MKVTSIAPLLIMRIKHESMRFLILGINTYFDDVYDEKGRANGDIEIKHITYTTHYGEIFPDAVPYLEVYVDGVWTEESDFV